MEKSISIQQAIFFSFLKKPSLKNKNSINISYLTMLLIKMRLSIFVVLSRYGLACKYGIVFHINILTSISQYLHISIYQYQCINCQMSISIGSGISLIRLFEGSFLLGERECYTHILHFSRRAELISF